MAIKYIYDPTLNAKSWFDETINAAGWFDDGFADDVGGGSPVNYTLTGAAGAYVISGQAALFKRGYTLTGGAGSYAIAGQAALFKRGYVLTGGAGSYAISGQSALFKRGYTLQALSGAYVIEGQNATFNYVAGGTEVPTPDQILTPISTPIRPTKSNKRFVYHHQVKEILGNKFTELEADIEHEIESLPVSDIDAEIALLLKATQYRQTLDKSNTQANTDEIKRAYELAVTTAEYVQLTAEFYSEEEAIYMFMMMTLQ